MGIDPAFMRKLGLLVEPGYLSAAECARIRAAMDRGAVEPAEIYADGAAVDESVRRTSNVDVDAGTIAFAEQRLNEARGLMERVLRVRLRSSEGPSFLRYRDGDFYRTHRDRGMDEAGAEAEGRLASVIIFLSSSGPGLDFTGGELRLYGVLTGDEQHAVDIVPETGLLVAFPSHVLHEVRPVTGGVRDAVVDWFY